ncbi:MAG: hypothetical protein ACXVQV_08535 [Actinomycetota bacterium]
MPAKATLDVPFWTDKLVPVIPESEGGGTGLRDFGLPFATLLVDAAASSPAAGRTSPALVAPALMCAEPIRCAVWWNAVEDGAAIAGLSAIGVMVAAATASAAKATAAFLMFIDLPLWAFPTESDRSRRSRLRTRPKSSI